MGLWSEGVKRSRGVAAEGVGAEKEQVSKTTEKEINWEDRHFQICLAILSCPVSDSHGFVKAPGLENTIERADRMVELLKKRHEVSQSISIESAPKQSINADIKKENKKKGLWSEGIERSKRPKYFDTLWNDLQQKGYSKGDDIMYFHVNESCEELGINIDDIDIHMFEDTYDVNIG